MVKRIAALAGLAAAVWALWLLFGPQAPSAVAHPPLPQGPDAIGQCATCHGPDAKPPTEAERGPLLPADHATYAPDSCATCHATVLAPSPLAPSYSSCATCHAGKGQTAALGNGETLVAAVDIPKYLASVHGTFSCTLCHEEQAKVPHDKLTAEGKRAFTQEMSERCTTCHKGPTASYEESFHGKAASLGVIRAATCTDCHTPHAVQAPARWTLVARAESCAICHPGATPEFAAGWMGHQEPSPAWFPAVFFAEKGFVALTSIVLALGIVHVELDVLRWGWDKVRRRKEDDE